MKTIAASAAATRALGARIASLSKPGDVFVLEGELGAGKTEFARGFVTSLNPAAPVKSPSFSILNIYETKEFPVYHFDFYRITDATEFGEIGFDDYADGSGVCLIEWGTLFPNVLPKGATIIRFHDAGNGVREIDMP